MMLLIEGKTEFERAINFAAWCKKRDFLVAMLRDRNVQLSMADREMLAKFINDEMKNPPGRRAADRRAMFERIPTAIQTAAAHVRQEIEERKTNGRTPYGLRKRLIQDYARQFGLDEQSILNEYERSRQPRRKVKARA
jgi:hypothetical protein